MIEPKKFLYKSNRNKMLINKFYDNLNFAPNNKYDRIISCAVLEHLVDLPKYLYLSTKKLKKNGYQSHSIPCEGYPVWDIAWYLMSGISFKIRTGQNFIDVQKHEHINNYDEINSLEKVKIENRKKILILSSMHKEDRNMFLSQIISFIKENIDIKIIWASHEPSDQENRYLSNIFKRNDLSVSIVESLKNSDKVKSKVTIVNSVGILSQLYWIVKLAYVGGGFSTGVHNLMEPAIAGVPTLFGPNYKKFKEAIEIVNLDAGHSIKNSSDLKNLISSYLCDEKKLIIAGRAARKIVNSHAGASKKIIDQIYFN